MKITSGCEFLCSTGGDSLLIGGRLSAGELLEFIKGRLLGGREILPATSTNVIDFGELGFLFSSKNSAAFV